MPKRKSDTVQGIRQDERRREKNKNKKARNEARTVNAIRENPRAVRDEMKRLRILDQSNKLDAPGKEKLSQLSLINREFGLAKFAREEQARKELVAARGGSIRNSQSNNNNNNHNNNNNNRQRHQPRGPRGPIIYRPGGAIPPPPPPRIASQTATHSRQRQTTQRQIQSRPRPTQTLNNSSIGPSAPSASSTPSTSESSTSASVSSTSSSSSSAPNARFLPPPAPPKIVPIPNCNGSTYQILQAGVFGKIVSVGCEASVHAVGRLQGTAKHFWSTRDPGQRMFSTTFGIGNVIAGWDNGCLGMRINEIRKLIIGKMKKRRKMVRSFFCVFSLLFSFTSVVY